MLLMACLTLGASILSTAPDILVQDNIQSRHQWCDYMDYFSPDSPMKICLLKFASVYIRTN